MRTSVLLVAILVPAGLLAAEGPEAASFTHSAKPILAAYCTGCHGADEMQAEMNLEAIGDQVNVGKDQDLWIRVAEMVRSGMMPPEDEPQMTTEERAQLLGWLEPALAAIDCREVSQPGRVTIRRLNRTEYNNTVRDLVGVAFQPADDFPADDVGNGFDNIAQVLSLSPLLMEKYLDAAEQIVSQALADETLRSRILGSESEDLRVVLERFATRSFRRRVAAEEIDRLVELVELGEQRGEDKTGRLQLPLQAILTSPYFLFRIEVDEDPAKIRTLGGYELATRLSYFLWSSMPDEQLFELAASNRLLDKEILRAEVKRMLADPKSVALMKNFAGQWLELRNLAKMTPDPERFPDFDEALRDAMRLETETFFAQIMQSDRSVLDLIDADYTFVNERLARHYGLTDVEGEKFREVKLTDPRRGGVLTHASILTLTSNPTRTSPVKRGKWILENILGAPPPPPPAGVEELTEGDDAELLGSLRERMEQHRMNPSCAVCHRTMDALGFGFENFDAIGAWREKDGRFEIDPSGELPGEQEFQGPAELRQLLKTTRQEQFTRCLVEKMFTYALGRAVESYDRCTTDEIVRHLAEHDYRFSELIHAIVASDAFQRRGIKGDFE